MKIERLGDIADIIAGQSPPSSSYNKNGVGIPFFQGKTDYGVINPTVRNWCTEPTKISLPDDILISVRAPVGPLNINNVKACIGRGLSAIRVKENISRDYVYFFLKINEKKIANLGVGSTFTAITQADLKEIKIPLLPFPSQLHIANILTKAENLIAQRKESIRLLDEYLKSTFLEMFGDPVRNEKGWEKKTIAEIGKDEKRAIKAGPFGSQLLLSELQPEGIPVYGIDNVQKNKFIEAKPKFITEKKFLELIAFKIEEEDILITRTGTVGRTCLAPKNIDKCIIGPNLLKISLDRSKVLPIYISIAFNYCESIVDSIKQLSPGATVAVFNTTNLKAIKLGIPPITLQTKFAHIVEKTEVLKVQYQQSLQALDNLYGSLSQRAFRGELTINDEEDLRIAAEPISEYKKQ